MKKTIVIFLSLFSILVMLWGISPEPVAADQNDNNVVIILDASGSMSEEMASKTIKMDAAKTALKEVLKEVPMDTNIGLLVFGKNLGNAWLYPLGPRNDVELIDAINFPQPGGTTPLGEYLKIGADQLLEQREKQYGYGTYRLLVVTDGEASDAKLLDSHLPDIISRGIIVDVIGVNMYKEHTLATKVNSYRRADDPDMLKRAVKEVFAEVGDDTGMDTTDEDAFALIAGIPDEMAGSMLEALSKSGNHPIGTAPENISKEGTADTGVSKNSGAGGMFFNFFITILFVIFVVNSLIKKSKKGNKR